MKDGKLWRQWIMGPILTRFLFCLSLLGLFVFAIACGSEGPSEHSRQPSSPAPVAEKADSEAGAPATSGTPPSTVAPATASTDASAGQETAHPDEVTPLQIKSIDFDPARPIAGEPIKVQVVFDKPEMASVPLHYRWKLNDETIEGLDTNIFEYPTKRGGRIEVAVFVGNRREESRARRASVIVDDSPPVVKKVEERLGSNSEYVARLETSDPDDDMVALSLQKGPPGMVLDPASKELHWSVPEGANGSFPVEVLASDPVGASALLSYSITIRQEQQSAGSAANATSVSSPPK
jgi:hypothetical protein